MWLPSAFLCLGPYRIGPREKYFHCDKCNLCLAENLLGKHKVIIIVDPFLCIPHCFPLLVIFLVSVCWKCLEAELPSVYGGNETYNSLGVYMRLFINCQFIYSLLWLFEVWYCLFCIYRIFTHPELELMFFHVVIYYISMICWKSTGI